MSVLVTSHLPLMAGAPNGIKKLRELILELAVRGKLVPQDPNDEPASEVLERIAAEKNVLVAQGKIKRHRPQAGAQKEKRPFEMLPRGWEAAHLSDVLAVVTDGDHQAPPKAVDGVPFLVIGNLSSGRISFEGCRRVPIEYFASLDWGRKPRKDDILYTVTGSFGIPIAVDVDERFCVQRHVAILKVCRSSPANYLRLLLGSVSAKNYAASIATGIAQKTVPLTGLRQLFVPVPPLAEQHRIVTKVEELMALCDRLEARQEDAESAQTQLVEALLGSLTQARDAHDFAASWQRLSEHFHTLFTTESSIDALKQTVLQLAVMGKLVPQDPSDEPASYLLKRIAAKKTRLVADAKIKLGKSLAAREAPCELPKGWEWSSLAQVALINPRNSAEDSLAVSFVSMTMIGTRFDGIHAQESRLWRDVKQGFTHFAEGDVGVAKITPCFENSKACVFSGLANGLGAGTTELHIVRTLQNTVDPRYVLAFVKSPQFLRDGEAQMTGTAGQKRLPKAFVEANPFPLPPLAEQRRIVAKVDELMALCDRLKSRIAEARGLSQKLATTLVQHALEGEPAPTTYQDAGGDVIHLASYLVSRMSDSPNFGRVALMKAIFLGDQHLGLGLIEGYERKAAGPFANEIYAIEQRAAQQGWFSHTEIPTKLGRARVVYSPGKNIAQASDVLIHAMGEGRAELDRLIALLAGKTTDNVEAIATLYAVWSDALDKGVRVDDDMLVNEVRTNWHESKERFTPQELISWLGWMRANQLVPNGTNRQASMQSSLPLG